MVGENIEIYYLKWLKMHSNCPPCATLVQQGSISDFYENRDNGTGVLNIGKTLFQNTIMVKFSLFGMKKMQFN